MSLAGIAGGTPQTNVSVVACLLVISTEVSPESHVGRVAACTLIEIYGNLGEHVYGLKAVNRDGDVPSSPALETVMSYDFQMRRHMVRMVNEGENLAEAIARVMADATLKERYFVTPNLMVMAAPPSSSRDNAPRSRSSSTQMQHYSFSKGGKGKSWPMEGLVVACGRLHVCMKCFNKHPYHSCPDLKKDISGGKGPSGNAS